METKLTKERKICLKQAKNNMTKLRGQHKTGSMEYIKHHDTPEYIIEHKTTEYVIKHKSPEYIIQHNTQEYNKHQNRKWMR